MDSIVIQCGVGVNLSFFRMNAAVRMNDTMRYPESIRIEAFLYIQIMYTKVLVSTFLHKSEAQARKAGFKPIKLVATRSGEKLHASKDYSD